MVYRYVGATATDQRDIVYNDYIDLIKGADLDSGEIAAAVTAGLSSYATKTYVDAQDSLLATTGYIDGQDNLRIKTASKGIANGVAPLDATGKIPTAFIDGPNTQQYFRGPWSPAAYNGAINATTETTLFTCAVTDPGYSYRLVVFGEVDGRTNLDAEFPQIVVRVATEASGQIVARGRGLLDAIDTFQSGDDFNRANADTLTGWDVVQTEGSDTNGIGIRSNEAKLLSTNNNSYRARRTDVNNNHTGTDFQRVSAIIGSDDGTDVPDPHLRLIGRMNDAATAWVAYEIAGDGSTRLVYANGGAEAQIGAASTITRFAEGAAYTMITGQVGATRTFYLYLGSTLVKTVVDAGSLTAMSSAHRGWGFQLRTSAGIFGTTERPPTLEQVQVGDGVVNYAPVTIIPADLNLMTPRTGATTLYIRGLRSGASSTSSFSDYKPRLHVMAIPA